MTVVVVPFRPSLRRRAIRARRLAEKANSHSVALLLEELARDLEIAAEFDETHGHYLLLPSIASRAHAV